MELCSIVIDAFCLSKGAHCAVQKVSLELTHNIIPGALTTRFWLRQRAFEGAVKAPFTFKGGKQQTIGTMLNKRP
ncbi:hypothetical protein CGG78_05460 [Vibrio parahaemolyticus]|nr:hypothetical protein CTT36_17340 [Vibrio parahaemolyticus]TOE40167.1 hypothetical protein CGJ43_12445 [Vibrio parahaemolyticus]TOL52393.1 hypothetical protein CGH98_09475 [Vibrio parahaemolyticus]TOO06013.1 hypothetical protein CGH45_05255 [Vibrio parahaemolyticus]TOR29201.1 hypothetical protein CGG78_05460 [Vibrio parahaemolyticus]